MSRVQKIGGPHVMVCVALYGCVSLVPAVGAIASAATYDAEDESISFGWWKVYGIGMALHLVMFMLCAQLILRGLQAIIEKITGNVVASAGSNHEVEDLIYRLKSTRKFLPVTLCTAGLFLASAFEFPFFSFLVVVNMLSSLFVCALVWFSFTTKRQRLRVAGERYVQALPRTRPVSKLKGTEDVKLTRSAMSNGSARSAKNLGNLAGTIIWNSENNKISRRRPSPSRSRRLLSRPPPRLLCP